MSDREMIRDLVARYNADGDSGRVDGVIALFWPDASMEVGGPDAPRVHTGHEEIASIFTGAAATTFRPAGGGEASSGQASSTIRRSSRLVTLPQRSQTTCGGGPC